jgi:hypothetical protein
MAVFSPNMMSLLQANLNAMRDNVVAHHRLDSLTKEDFLQLFVRPDHRKLLDQVQEITGGVGSFSHFDTVWTASGEKLYLRFNFSRHVQYIMPAYSAKGPSPKAPLELVQRVDDWAIRRLQIAKDFALVHAVLEAIDNWCDNKQQARFFFAGLLALVPDKQADQLRDNKVPREIPTLPPALRVACTESNKIISRAKLLPLYEGSPAYELKAEVYIAASNASKGIPMALPFSKSRRYMDNRVSLA